MQGTCGNSADGRTNDSRLTSSNPPSTSPERHMPASIAQRNTADPACRKEDLSTGIGKVLGDLTTRLTASHDKNSARFEYRGTAVARSIDLGDV